jgi:DNA repair exonuclease SbcCD nuclease subunit
MYPFQNYGSPKEVEIGGVKILFLPWIPENNIDAMNASLEAIKNSKAQICMGHLELAGFEMERGHLSQHGLSKSMFSKFEFVFSGHFHTKSQQDNIYYLGAPFEFTWGDYGTRKGFHVFDLRSRALEFVENPFKLFQRLVYNDTNIASPAELIPPELPAKVVNSYVKVIIEAKTNPYFFDRFIAQLETFNFHDLKVINQEELSIDKSDMIDSCEDTMTIVGKTIDKLDVDVDKFLLKELMNELYKEALVMEVE